MIWHPIALIFDTDGLIIDTEQIAREMYMRAITDCGFRFDNALLPVLL